MLVVALVLAALAITSAGGWLAWATFVREDGPSYPDEWDPRVAALADYVADHQGIPFATPVHVDFLTEEEYRVAVTVEEAELTDDDREAYRRSAAQWRALGLVEGDYDLFQEQNEFQGTWSLAFYDTDTKRVTVRGTELTTEVEVTVVHELVHAWQDQQVDLAAVEDSLEGEGYLPYRSIVEGHAVLVMNDYVVEELSEAEREEYVAGDPDPGVPAGDGEAEPVAPTSSALAAFLSAPYVFGPSFVAVVTEVEGEGAVVDLLRDPPSSIQQLVDPTRYLRGVEPVEVDVMDPPDGAEVVDGGTFEVLELYLALASRTDAGDAMEAADGWAGGSYVAYEDADGTVCVGLRIEADSPEARTALADAFTAWADHLPSATVATPSSPTTVEVTSCDPGVEASTDGANPLDEALIVPAARAALMTEVLTEFPGGADADQAWCVADGVVDELTVEELKDTAPVARKLQRLVRDTMADCGVSP